MVGLRDAVYGAAIGDALGVPYEFMGRESFDCVGMTSGGTYDLPAGTFSDDTSMMIAMCDSIRVCGEIDTRDIRERFNDWLRNGAYTSDGNVFDVGNTVATALHEGVGCTGERSNGNGSLMRIAPLAYTDASDDEVRAVSAITHAHRISMESCVCFVNLGSDSDTTACVAGALAGAAYGYDAIPSEWIEVLRGKDVIESCLF